MRKPDWFTFMTDRKSVPKMRVVVPGVFRQVERYQAAVSGGPTSGTTELTLATIDIPARPFAYTVSVAAHWTAINSAVSDNFAFRTKVDGVSKAIVENRWNSTDASNIRKHFSIPSSTEVTVPADTTCQVTVTVQRTIGTGTLTQSSSGVATATVIPQGTS